MKKLIFFFSLALSLFGDCNNLDIAQYVIYKNHTYGISKDLLTYDESLALAEKHEGYLSIPNTQEENDFLIKNGWSGFIGVLDSTNLPNYCMNGINCIASDSRFSTYEGNLIWKNWAINEPNNIVYTQDMDNNINPLGENWVVLKTSGEWESVGNHYFTTPYKAKAIIEINKELECVADGAVEDDVIPDSGYWCSDEDNLKECSCEGFVENGKCFEWEYADKVTSYSNNLTPTDNNCSNYGVGCSSTAFGWGVPSSYPVANLLASHSPLMVYQNGSYRGQIKSWSEVTQVHNQCDGYGIRTNSMSAGCFNGKCNRGTGFSFCYKTSCDKVAFRTNSGVGCENGCTGYYCKNTANISCDSGFSKVTVDGKATCQKMECPNGFNEFGNNTLCRRSKEKVWTCSLGNYQCVDFGKESNIETPDTTQGENDKSADGTIDENGSCSGSFYIFNGKDTRCREKDKFFGLTGGGCCDKDKVFLGLVECKPEEKNWAEDAKSGKTHLVGSYCAKKIVVLGCILTKQTHCKFNSKLARIIHEQGRPQINLSWGDAKSPECRGFTPEEFQRLDFSKIDLSEYVADIQAKVSNFANLGQFVSDKVNNFYQEQK